MAFSWPRRRFVCHGFCHLTGFNLAKSTAHAKLLNATSNVGGLLPVSSVEGYHRPTGFVMMAGQFVAPAPGQLVLSKGQSLIRPMIVIILGGDERRNCFMTATGLKFLQWLGIH